MRNRNRVFAAPARAGVKRSTARTILYGICRPCKGGGGVICECGICKGGQTKYIFAANCFREAEQSQKIYIFGKKCIISAFFLQLSAKKNNKDYIKTLDTEQNADYTIMDWVYWLFNASLSKYHQEEKT